MMFVVFFVQAIGVGITIAFNIRIGAGIARRA